MAVDELPLVKSMTVPQLRAELERRGLDPMQGSSKKDLSAAVEAARAKEEGPVDVPQDGESAEEPVEPTQAEIEQQHAQPQGDAAALTEAHTQALELREAAVPAQHALPGAGEFNAIMAIADRLAHSRIVPAAYQGKPDNIVAAIMFGRELGVGPMQSLKAISVIEDKPAPSAELLLAVMKREGLVIVDSGVNMERAWIRGRRSDNGEEMQVDWTYAEAEKIRSKGGKALVDKDNWKNYRVDMLWARAVGRLARRLMPDKVAGMGYAAEEVQDFNDEGWGTEYGNFERPTYKQDAPENPVPRNEAEIFQRMSALVGVDEAREWLREAVVKWAETQNVTVANYRELPLNMKAVVGQKLAGVVLDLEQRETETGEDLRMSTGVREKTAKAFAARLDGLVLEGPAWRLGPDEESLPARGSSVGQPGGSGDATDAPSEAGGGSDQSQGDDPETIDAEPIAEEEDIDFPEAKTKP